MLYGVWKFEEKLDLEKLKEKGIAVSKSEILIPIDGQKSSANFIDIEENITFRDYLRRKKLSDDDIDELAEYTINKLIPNASSAEKETAIKSYLEDIRGFPKTPTETLFHDLMI